MSPAVDWYTGDRFDNNAKLLLGYHGRRLRNAGVLDEHLRSSNSGFGPS